MPDSFFYSLTPIQFHRFLRRARWLVPVSLTILVLLFESYEHEVRFEGRFLASYSFWYDFIFFGVLGPLVVGWTLNWMSDIVQRLVQTQQEREHLFAQVQQKEEARRQLVSFLMNAQEEERKRVARDLHDSVSQSMTAFVYASDGLKLTDFLQQRKLETARQAASQSLDAIRELIPQLRPPKLDSRGLWPALREYADNIFDRSSPNVVWQLEGESQPLDPHVKLALFRVLQETLNNVCRHAQAHQVQVKLRYTNTYIQALVKDDGIGFNMQNIHPTANDLRGVGLLGMEERIALVNGQIHIQSTPGKGTSVEIEIPLSEKIHE